MVNKLDGNSEIVTDFFQSIYHQWAQDIFASEQIGPRNKNLNKRGLHPRFEFTKSNYLSEVRPAIFNR